MSKTYRIKEIFYSLQGEGKHSGRPAIFCRFSKCNLWNGREDSRSNSVCQFCDTDFVGTDGELGGFYSADSLLERLIELWPNSDRNPPFIVLTGGEPALQLDQALVDTLKSGGCELAIETNGTLPLPNGLDWICLSPKSSAEVVIKQCHELKLVYPQADCPPEKYQDFDAKFFYLSPKAEPLSHQILPDHTAATIAYCKAHPQWRLNLQTHKILNIA